MIASKKNHLPKLIGLNGVFSSEIAFGLAAVNSDIAVIPRYTTRTSFYNSEEKKGFIPVSHSEFRRMLLNDELAEVTLYGDNFYFTRREDILAAAAVDKIAVLFDCNQNSFLQLQSSLPTIRKKDERSIFIVSEDPVDFYMDFCRQNGDAEICSRLERSIQQLSDPVYTDAVFICKKDDYNTLVPDILDFIYDKADIFDNPDFRSGFCAELQKRLNTVPKPQPDALLKAHTPSLSSKDGDELVASLENIEAKYHSLYSFSADCQEYLLHFFRNLAKNEEKIVAEGYTRFYNGNLPRDNFEALITCLHRTCTEELGEALPEGISQSLQFECIEHLLEHCGFDDRRIAKFRHTLLRNEFTPETVSALSVIFSCLPENWFRELRPAETIAVHELGANFLHVMDKLKAEINEGISVIDRILERESAFIEKEGDDIS